MTFFSCRLLATPIFPRRLSSYPVFFLTSATKKINFRSGVTPWRVSPVAVRLAPPLVTPLTTGRLVGLLASHCLYTINTILLP